MELVEFLVREPRKVEARSSVSSTSTRISLASSNAWAYFRSTVSQW